jgi:hypothetical protein
VALRVEKSLGSIWNYLVADSIYSKMALLPIFLAGAGMVVPDFGKRHPAMNRLLLLGFCN